MAKPIDQGGLLGATARLLIQQADKLNQKKEMTMELKTRLGKGREGWEAETNYPLDGEYILAFRTSKRHSGMLATTVTRYKLTDGGMSFIMFQDFNQVVASEKVRVTEKSVIAQHGAALAKIDEIRAEVDAFYAMKEAA